MSEQSDRLFPGRHFINATLEAVETKAAMSSQITVPYLQRAGMAGILIGTFYGAYYSTVAIFAQIPAGETTLVGVGRVLGSLVFGWALVFIYFTKSELLTSNMMVATIGVYHRRITWQRGLSLLSLCFLGNALGGLLLAVLVKGSSLAQGAVLEQMTHSVEVKLGYITSGPTGMLDLFTRAILCNLMINVAMLLIYNGFLHDDLTKSLAMVMAVFIFAFLGLEHSVANTVLFTIIGLKQGIDVGLAAANVGIALLGNFIGGGLLIGLYYAYLNDDRRHLDSDEPAQA